MEVKPGYKQTEVGVIPEDWDLRGLSEVAQVDPENLPAWTDPNYSFNYISLEQVDAGRLLSVAEIVFRTAPSRARRVLRHNDVLMSTVRPNLKAHLHFRSQVPNAICSTGFAVLRAHSGLADPAYIFAHLFAHAVNKQIEQTLAGSNYPAINSRDVRALAIPCPSTVIEQRAIAAALSDMDALLGGLDRLIAKKRDLKQAAMQQLLTGQTRLPGFSGAWEVKRLGDVGKCLRGVSYKGDSDLSTHDTPHTKRLLRSNNIQNAVVVTDEVQFVNAARVSSHQILQEDDILICMANGSKALVGKAGIFTLSDGHEYTFGAFMGCFRTNSTEANPAFVFYLFLTARYRDYINNLLAGSSINNLRPSSIESLEFSTPPLPEQTAIAAVLSDMDAELAALEARRDKTRDLKQAMMQELLTGKTRLVKPEAAHA